MKFSKKTFAKLASAVALCLIFSGCSKKQETSNSVTQEGKIKEGGTITLGFASEMNNFDPFTAMTADARSINFNIFDGLVNVATDGSMKPAIAKDYSISDDAVTYTFTIRDDVKFHDGKLLTMDDVVYSVQKAIDNDQAGYKKIKDYNVNENKLTLNLKTPDAGFIAYLTMPIVQKDAENLALNPIGTGPYKFVELVEQDHLTLAKNNDYFGEKGHLDTVVVKFATSQASLILDFQSGSIDGFSANAEVVEQLDKSNVNIYQKNSNMVQLLALNNKVKPFDNIKFRQALWYLIDAKEIIDTVNYGYGVKTGSALIPSLSKYYDLELDSVYDVDINKAKILLAEAGYENGASFTITVPSNYTVHVKSAEVIVNQLAKVGIKAQIKQVDWPTWLQNVYTQRDYEATIISLDGALAYPTSYLSRYHSSSKKNFVNFESKEFDAAYDKAVASINDDEKVTYFKQAQRVLTRDAASVFIEDISSLTVYTKKFAGSRDYPVYVSDFSAIYCVE